LANFILGGLFFYIALPILETILSAFCTRIEQYKAKCGVEIAKYNSQIAQINMGEEPTSACPIGFQYNEAEEDDEESYED
jgi:hypothetical protein